MQIVLKIISEEICFLHTKKSDFKEIIISSKPKPGGNSVGDMYYMLVLKSKSSQCAGCIMNA